MNKNQKIDNPLFPAGLKIKTYQPYYDFEKPSKVSGENGKLAEQEKRGNANKEKAQKYLAEFLRTQEEKYLFKAINEHDFITDTLVHVCSRRESEDSESTYGRPSVDFVELLLYQVLLWKHEAIANNHGKAKQARRYLQKLGECMIRKKKQGRSSKLNILLAAKDLKRAVREYYKAVTGVFRQELKQADRYNNLNLKNKYKKDKISEIVTAGSFSDINGILQDLDKLMSKTPSQIAKHIICRDLGISQRTLEEFIK